MDESNMEKIQDTPDDIQIEWFSGTGKGGQHRNKHQNSCRLIHTSTGLVVSAQCRSRKQSYQQAYDELIRRLSEQSSRKKQNKNALIRKNQIGSGMRSDKKRTYRLQYGVVIDHTTGRKISEKEFKSGKLFNLW
jgi:peptide chain release factor 1